MNKIIFFIPVLFMSTISTAYSDSYIDRVTGDILGTDGATSDNLRVIDIREWNYIIEEKQGTYSKASTTELHNNSFIVMIDEDQIQNEIQKMAKDSVEEELENQVFIVLNVNNGKIFALRDMIEEGKTDKGIIINTYTVGLNSAPRIGEGLMLLAQIHSHPKEKRENKKNIRSVSEGDMSVAKNLGITIFAIDTFDVLNKDKYSTAFHIHSTREGTSENFVGQTIGKEGLNTFNFSAYLNGNLRRKLKNRKII